MRKVKGNNYQGLHDILGVITYGSNIFSRKNKILVKKGLASVPSGYIAAITDVTPKASNSPIVGNVNNLDEFNEGDVVVIDKVGQISFLFEKNSEHNAVFVTERCNHRCIMCPQPPVVNEDDKTEFNLSLIKLFDKETKEVGITGGEPTMLGDKLFDIIRQIKKSCPQASIGMLSNGVKFADRNYALKLAKCNHPDIQIDIPLFSDIAEEHNRIVGAKTFYKTVEGMYNLAQLEQRIGVRIVIHKQTYKRLPQLADFIYHNFPFVVQVAFLQMETTGLAEKHLSDLWIDPYDYNKELEEAINILELRGLPAYIYNAQLCVLPEHLRPYAMNSITDWKDAFLPECDGCSLRQQCPGVFLTNGRNISKHLRKIQG